MRVGTVGLARIAVVVALALLVGACTTGDPAPQQPTDQSQTSKPSATAAAPPPAQTSATPRHWSDYGDTHPYPQAGTMLTLIGKPARDNILDPDAPELEPYIIYTSPSFDAEVRIELFPGLLGTSPAAGENVLDAQGVHWVAWDTDHGGGWSDAAEVASVAEPRDITADLDLEFTGETWEDLAEFVVQQRPLAVGTHEIVPSSRPTFDDVIAIQIDLLIPQDGALRGEQLLIYFDIEAARVEQTGWTAIKAEVTDLCDPGAPSQECLNP